LVTRFVEDVPLGGVGNVTDCISTTQYHPIPPQRSPFITDGLEGPAAGLAVFAARGKAVACTTLHKVLVGGNFVLTLAEVSSWTHHCLLRPSPGAGRKDR
ncbi:hypothetical protein AB0E04_16940, partial [Streptomyces sp. NPDC048251]